MTVPSLQDSCVETVARRMPYEVTFTCDALPIPELVQSVYIRYAAVDTARRAAGSHSPAAHLAALRQFATCWQPHALNLSLPGLSGQSLDELAALSSSLAHLQLACPVAASLAGLTALTGLTCLGLRGCSSATPEALQQVLQGLPQLLALDLSQLVQVSDSLAPTLAQLKQLAVLQLSHTSCSDATVDWLTYGSRLHEWQRQQQQQQQQGGSDVQLHASAHQHQRGGDWPRTRIRQWHLAHAHVTAKAAELLVCCPDIIFLDLRGSGVKAYQLLPLRTKFRLSAVQGAVLSRSAAMAAAAVSHDAFLCADPSAHSIAAAAAAEAAAGVGLHSSLQHWVLQGVQELLKAKQAAVNAEAQAEAGAAADAAWRRRQQQQQQQLYCWPAPAAMDASWPAAAPGSAGRWPQPAHLPAPCPRPLQATAMQQPQQQQCARPRCVWPSL